MVHRQSDMGTFDILQKSVCRYVSKNVNCKKCYLIKSPPLKRAETYRLSFLLFFSAFAPSLIFLRNIFRTIWFPWFFFFTVRYFKNWQIHSPLVWLLTECPSFICMVATKLWFFFFSTWSNCNRFFVFVYLFFGFIKCFPPRYVLEWLELMFWYPINV